MADIVLGIFPRGDVISHLGNPIRDNAGMGISVVIPVYNEADCIVPLVREIETAAKDWPLEEIVVVDDGSGDNTPAALNALKKTSPSLRVLTHKQRSGQSTALRTGITHARGELVVTLDGDGQNDPADIVKLYKAYQENATRNPRLLVAGQRAKRHDNLLRRLSSRVANKVRAFMLDDGVRDTGCSLKLFRRTDFVNLPFFNHIHRFIPALMKASGALIVLIDVSHRPRLRGVSKYGLWNRLWVGVADLFGVRWLLSRTKPLTEVTENDAIVSDFDSRAHLVGDRVHRSGPVLHAVPDSVAGLGKKG